jgi:hypothetical protein
VCVCVRTGISRREQTLETAKFGTFTEDLEKLEEWLKQRKVRPVCDGEHGRRPWAAWRLISNGPCRCPLTPTASNVPTHDAVANPGKDPSHARPGSAQSSAPAGCARRRECRVVTSNPVGQAHARHLAKGRVGLLRRGGIYAGANTAPLRTGLKRRAGGPIARRFPPFSHELVEHRHEIPSGFPSGSC